MLNHILKHYWNQRGNTNKCDCDTKRRAKKVEWTVASERNPMRSIIEQRFACFENVSSVCHWYGNYLQFVRQSRHQTVAETTFISIFRVIINISLKWVVYSKLYKQNILFSRKMIQEASHNPVIDAKASLQLVLLKLRNSLEFGDVIVNGCTNIYNENQLKESIDLNIFGLDLSNSSAISRFIYQTGLNIDQNFFSLLKSNQIKSKIQNPRHLQITL